MSLGNFKSNHVAGIQIRDELELKREAQHIRPWMPSQEGWLLPESQHGVVSIRVMP